MGKDLSIQWDDKLAERILSEREIAKLEKAAMAVDLQHNTNKMHWLLFTQQSSTIKYITFFSLLHKQ
ncbi:hypothetical protein QUB80_01655 [Chlorogloeopsis sp. ULAP01]|uniref:hypothetical protein n=1 Tax=Chlorogloeopsis sp. ULAP01 TaxID=3056483 RepID=UPI0025AB5088|nr:hypothetical protein [Chlorogloeopsis sp. ULAP01]MDM9379412.1 hypothetical protein [Chlorogloeopsis sp. ULAP01]